MKRVFAILTIAFAIGLINNNMAQVVEDALRYSFYDIGGTARYVSMGGSMGALGGDFSMLGDNPAGIGVFRTSQFVLTPTLISTGVESSYFGTKSSDDRLRFNVGNLGYVQSFNFERSKGLVGFSFGIGYNRINDFYTNQYITGTNPNNSMADYFANNANRTAPESLYPFGEGLAWQGWVIDSPDDSLWNYHSVFADSTGYSPNMYQQRAIQTDGRINQWTIALGGNISNKLYLGLTFDFNDAYYQEYWLHYERPNSTQQSDTLSYFDYDNDLTVSGFGFNFKGGIIYKPFNFLRFGAAFHSPTWYSISESYYNTLGSDSTSDYYYGIIGPIYYDQYDSAWYGTGIGVNDYAISTPFKVLGSVAFQFGKYGLLNFDYEFCDYSSTTTKDKNGGADSERYFKDLNKGIDTTLQIAHTLKAGGEVKLGIFSLRQGFAYYTSPWSDKSLHTNFQQYMYSGGVGVRLQRITIDFAYSWLHKEDTYVLYQYPFENTFIPATADVNYNSLRFMLTLGLKL